MGFKEAGYKVKDEDSEGAMGSGKAMSQREPWVRKGRDNGDSEAR